MDNQFNNQEPLPDPVKQGIDTDTDTITDTDTDANKIDKAEQEPDDIGSPYEFKGPPSYVPRKYNRSSSHKVLPAIVVALCVLFGGAGFAFGAVYGGDKSVGNADASYEESAEASETETLEPTSEPTVLYTVDRDVYYTVTSAVDLTIDTVVEITTETISTSAFMKQYITEGAGSGVILTEDGYIVTNNHVVDGASNITVRLRDGTEHDAVLVGTDAESDIAVIKIEQTGLHFAEMGDSDTLEVGEPIIAIGNPLGELGGTVTEGIVSALERQINVDGKLMTLLQHSAAVNPGNSGGGLFNMSGQLIGIVNAKYSQDNVEGLGFAIPSSGAVAIINDIVAYGYVRGRIDPGVEFVDIYSRNYAIYYGVSEYGTYVYSVGHGSDAATAGLKSGDRIDAVNGVSISAISEIEDAISVCKVGDSLTLTITRFTSAGGKTVGEQMTVTLTFTEYKPSK